MADSAGGAGSRRSSWPLRLIAGVALAGLAACSPVYRNHGYVPLDSDLAAITLGVDTRETVAQTVGTPTAGGLLDQSAFYYVRSRFRHLGLVAPQEIDREVLAISFAADGTVANIERFGLEDGQVVALSRRVTDNSVRDTTFLRQLLGNIGNFNAGSLIGENDVPR